MKVMNTDKIIPKTTVCAKLINTFFLLFSPMLFAISEVPPTVTPTQAAIIIK